MDTYGTFKYVYIINVCIDAFLMFKNDYYGWILMALLNNFVL